LSIQVVNNLEGAALGASICGWLLNIPQLQRLDLSYGELIPPVIRAMQSGLRNSNRSLKELNLFACTIGDDGIQLLADYLVGNTAMLELIIGYNSITSNGLDDITRMIESTQLQTIKLKGNEAFNNVDSVQRFAAKLIQKTIIQVLKWIQHADWPHSIELRDTINSICARNACLNHVGSLLLAPPPPPRPQQQPQPFQWPQQQQPQPQQQQSSKRNFTSTTTLWIKTYHKAIAKFANVVPNNAGVCAIFKLLTARPQLLEKRIKRPASAAAAAAVADADSSAAAAALLQEQKRRRLY
jgi:Leucine Rich repeat